MKTIAAARLDRATCAALVAAVLMPVALGLIFFYVPNDADQGFSQRIFYFHVPIAMTTYALFAWGALNAARYLWTGDMSLDLRSYVPMHLGVIFGTLTLVTGSFWAKVSWGTWWYWGSTELNTFLIIFLFYCAYFMLRFSVDPGEKRARYSAVYALLGVGLIPISVLAASTRMCPSAAASTSTTEARCTSPDPVKPAPCMNVAKPMPFGLPAPVTSAMRPAKRPSGIGGRQAS